MLGTMKVKKIINTKKEETTFLVSEAQSHKIVGKVYSEKEWDSFLDNLKDAYGPSYSSKINYTLRVK